MQEKLSKQDQIRHFNENNLPPHLVHQIESEPQITDWTSRKLS